MRKAFAAFLAIIFFLLLPGGLLNLAVQTLFLSPGFYKELLLKNDVYGKSYALASAAFGESRQFSRDIPLTSPEMEQVLRQVIPPDYIQRQAEAAIDEVFAWLDSSDPLPRITIPLGEVKARLPSALTGALERKLSNLPRCAPGYQPPPDGIPNCLPEGVELETIKGIMRQEALRAGQELARTLPESVSLSEVMARAGQDGEGPQAVLDSLKQAVSMFKQASMVVYVLLAVLLMLIGLLVYGPLGASLQWLGTTLLVSGLVILVAVLVGNLSVSMLLEGSIEAELQTAPGVVSSTVVGLLRAIQADFIARLYLESGAAAGLGLVLLIVGRLLMSAEDQ